MRKVLLSVAGSLVTAVLGLFATAVVADEARVYDEGPVIEVTSVRTRPGMFDEYMKFLAGPWRQEQEELKKIGVVQAYNIYSTTPRSPSEPDLFLVVTYKNMGAFDGLMDKSEPIEKKIYGSMKAAEKGAIDREAMRTIIGSEIDRELKLR